MNPWWKMAFAAFWTFAVAMATHTVDLWHDGYTASKQEASQIQSMDKADGVFLLGQQSIIDFNQQWSIDREKDPHPCPLPPDSLKLLR